MPTLHKITAEEKKFYDENGYLVVENLFSHEECDRILSLAEKYADEKFSNAMNLDRQDPEIRKVMIDPRNVACVEGLLGQEVVALMSQVLFKRLGTPYASQAWNPHQDNSYPKARYGTYMQVNMHLESCDLENGCVYAYPGSHKEEILPYEPTISFREKPGTNPGNKVKVPSKYKQVNVTGGKGSILLLHSHLIHGSHPNISKTRSRPVYSIAYIVKGEKFEAGKNGARTPIPVR